jgi:hypothetical protein
MHQSANFCIIGYTIKSFTLTSPKEVHMDQLEPFAHYQDRLVQYYDSKSRESHLRLRLTKTIRPLLMPSFLVFLGSLMAMLLIAKVDFFVPIPPFIIFIGIVIWGEVVTDSIQKEKDTQAKIISEL